MLRSWWLVLCLVALETTACTPAVATPPPPPPSPPSPPMDWDPIDPRDTARTLADEGFALYEAGNYARAFTAFSAAYGHFKAPTLLLMVARTREKLGQLRKAYELYRQIALAAPAPHQPVPYHKAYRSAVAELATLERRMPAVQIQVTGAPTSKVSLMIDGTIAVEPGKRIPLDPGRHEITAYVPGRSIVKQEVVLVGNATQSVKIALSTTAVGPGEP